MFPLTRATHFGIPVCCATAKYLQAASRPGAVPALDAAAPGGRRGFRARNGAAEIPAGRAAAEAAGAAARLPAAEGEPRPGGACDQRGEGPCPFFPGILLWCALPF